MFLTETIVAPADDCCTLWSEFVTGKLAEFCAPCSELETESAEAGQVCSAAGGADVCNWVIDWYCNEPFIVLGCWSYDVENCRMQKKGSNKKIKIDNIQSYQAACIGCQTV